MDLPRSSFYAAPASAAEDPAVAVIRSITETCRNYGYRRVTAELRHRGLVVNAKKVRRIMRENAPWMRTVVRSWRDHGKDLIDQRADLSGQLEFHPLGAIHQRIHRAKQMLVGDGLGHCRHRHGLQPAQAARLARGVAQPVEHHGADEGLPIGSATPRPQGPAKRAVETEVLPERMPGEDVPITARALPGDLGLRRLVPPCNPAEAPDQGVELAVLHSVGRARGWR